MAYLPFQVGVDIVIAMVLGQIDQDTCSTSAISLSAEATVANSTAGWAPPGLDKRANVPFNKLTPDTIHTHNFKESLGSTPSSAVNISAAEAA